MLDKWVIDIETKNSFEDVGGKHNLKKLEISLIGVFSYLQNEYLSFEEKEFHIFEKEIKKVGAFIGFATNIFDLPIIEHNFPNSFPKSFSIDILEEIEKQRGHKISLNAMAKENIGIEKNGSGLEAINLYHQGKINQLKEYCLQDVKITKELYEFGLKNNYLVVPSYYSQPVKINLDWEKFDFKLKELEKQREKELKQINLF